MSNPENHPLFFEMPKGRIRAKLALLFLRITNRLMRAVSVEPCPACNGTGRKP